MFSLDDSDYTPLMSWEVAEAIATIREGCRGGDSGYRTVIRFEVEPINLPTGKVELRPVVTLDVT
jgi:hypothetical protein